ncbi:MAG: SGNH/GDSL hydrolase family protein [Pseudomonadota bacterium]
MRGLAGNLMLAAASLLVTLGLIEVALWTMPVVEVARTQTLARDGKPFDVSSKISASVTYSDGWAFRNPQTKRTNNFGFFSRHDYLRGADAVLAIGDSYTEAAQVSFGQTFHQIAARRIGRPVYNFGLSGAPLSQYEAYLEQACEMFRPRAAAFAIIHNDFDESFRGWRARDGFFHYDDSPPHALTPTPYDISMLRRIATQSSLVRYLFFNLHLRSYIRQFTSGSAATHSVSIAFSGASNAPAAIKRAGIDRFLDGVATYCLPKTRIIFLLDTDREAIYAGVSRRDENMMYFRSAAKARGFITVDLHDAFARTYMRDARRFDAITDPHWNARGHALVGQALVTALRTIPDIAKSSQTSALDALAE